MSNTPQRFTKRPVTIEAAQLSETRPAVVIDWIRSNGGSAWIDETGSLSIRTLEGVMYANEGDWIVRGVQGEFYPCKPDIFTQTYQPAAEHVEGEQADPTDAEVRAGAEAAYEVARIREHFPTEFDRAPLGIQNTYLGMSRAALTAARESTRHE